MGKNLRVNITWGGGPFSRLFHIGILQIPSLIDTSPYDTITFKDGDFYDGIFEEFEDNEDLIIGIGAMAPYPRDVFHSGAIDFKDIQTKVIDKIALKTSFLDKLTSLEKEHLTGKNILGVHIRLTDMNPVHGAQTGFFNYRSFAHEVDKMLSNHPDIDQLFIASDNFTSLEKLKDSYGDLISYIPDLLREDGEESTLLSGAGISIMKTGVHTLDRTPLAPKVYEEAFYEMWLLSKTHKLIYRDSSLSCCAVVWSNTLNEVVCINNS